MKIKLSNIQGLIPFKVLLCDAEFNFCEIIDENYRKTSFEMDYDGELSSVGLKIITKNGKEYKKVFSSLMSAFVDCPLEISVQSINPTPNDSNGGATVIISNCYGKPDIMWSTGDETLLITGLTGGSYSIMVTDPSKNNCFKTEEFTLYEDFFIQVENLREFKFLEFISNNDYQINWGDGFVLYDSGTTDPSKKYYNPYTGTITIRSISLKNIVSIVENYCIGKVIFETKELAKLISLTKYENNKSRTVGLFSDLPTTLESLVVAGNVSGDTSNLPTSLIKLKTSDDVFISGDTINLPTNLTNIEISKNSISGDISNLPVNLTSITISDFTTIEGNITDLPSNLTKLIIKGNNNLYGDVSDLPLNLTHLEVWGNNTISGNTSGFPQNLESIILAGNNILEGNIGDLPQSLNFQLYLAGSNIVGGDVATIPSGLTYVYIGGVGTTAGQYLNGDIDTIPSGITSLTILGYNEISGELLYTSEHQYLTYLDIQGNNTISGNTENLPKNLSSIRILGSNTMNIFTGDTKTYWPDINKIILVPVTPFSVINVDNLLNSLVTLAAKPTPLGYLIIKGYLDLTNETTKNNFDELVTRGFKINISPNL